MDQQSYAQQNRILRMARVIYPPPSPLRRLSVVIESGTLNRVIALLLTYLVCFAAQAAAPTEPVFGPKIYTRSGGAPVTVTDTFTVPAGVTAPFLLRIENGDPAVPRAKGVTSARVVLNGVQILAPGDFTGQVALIERTVTLAAGTNTLTVTVSEPNGGGFRLRILGTRIPTVPTALAPNPIAIVAGASGNLTATLSPAPSAAGTLTVTSANPSVATVPASVAFNAGQTSVVIPVTAIGQGGTAVTASLNGTNVSAAVNVSAPLPTMSSIAPATLSIAQGVSGTLTVTLTSAPTTATSVNVVSSAPGVASVPATVSVAAGSLTAAIPVSGVAPGTAQITASLNGSSRSATVSVTAPPPAVSSLTPVTLNIVQGSSGTLTVTLTSAPAVATTVTLFSDATGIATVPTSVSVAAGALTAVVPVAAVAAGTARISASLNGTSQTATVTVTSAIIISGPTPKDVTLPGGSKPEIGAAYSTSSAIDTNQVTMRLNGQDVTAQALIGNLGALYVPTQALPNGTYTVSLTVRDLTGNVATETWSFTVDDPAPNFYSETPRDVFLVNAQPSIQVFLSAFNVDHNSIRILLDGADVTAQANVSTTFISITPGAPLAEGLHTVNVNATDGRGIAASKTWRFTIIVLPPPADTTDGERTPNPFVPEVRVP